MKRGRDKFNDFRKYIKIVTKFYGLFPKRIQKYLLVLHRRTSGYLGLVIRYALLKNLANSVGDNVSIQPDVYLFNLENLSIGNNVSIHSMSYIDSIGGITIGNVVSIAHGTSLISFNHKFAELGLPIKDQGIELCPIRIESNVWIGAKANILGGIIIGEGSIIGAGAVVTKNVKENSVFGGNPAHIIKMR